jgi:hypothetical protein
VRSSTGDDEQLAAYASELADAVDGFLADWVARVVRRTMTAWQGDAPAGVMAEAAVAGERARADVGPAMRALLATDVDRQRSNPLDLLRDAVRFPTQVLRDAGVPPVERDELQERLFPGDDYDLTPANFADVHPSLHDLGIRWGAAKAHVVLRRRRDEGRR